MVNIGRGKFRRMTSNRFREVRVMFRMKLRDGTNAITSGTGYVASRMTSIKHRKVLVLLGKERACMMGSGMLSVLEPLYLYSKMMQSCDIVD